MHHETVFGYLEVCDGWAGVWWSLSESASANLVELHRPNGHQQHTNNNNNKGMMKDPSESKADRDKSSHSSIVAPIGLGDGSTGQDMTLKNNSSGRHCDPTIGSSNCRANRKESKWYQTSEGTSHNRYKPSPNHHQITNAHCNCSIHPKPELQPNFHAIIHFACCLLFNILTNFILFPSSPQCCVSNVARVLHTSIESLARATFD